MKLDLEITKPGSPFDGIGGNFRLQFPDTDPAVLTYNLDNLRVAWGRLDMPWAEWDPDERLDPLVAARAGQYHRKVRDAMEAARTLARRKIPGLPESGIVWRRFITDANWRMEEHEHVEARSGTAEFDLPPASFTTLLGNPSP